ncbi:histidine kinase [Fibrella sp. HMF5335]|uniref:Histidine kinase n=1 Tax=Fibrella rubiginis TaxID=2817060 RepID=A0A939GFJ2_9BACT|nr:histidine kinase [Fibrella rubiginis]MBO0935850.1 histidine kinase [Fibrella rubiginis]
MLAANLLFLNELQYQLKAYLIWTVVGIAFALLLWEAIIRWLLYTRQRYAAIGQTGRRVLMTFIGYLVITALLESLFIGISNALAGTNAGPVGIETYLKRIGVWFFGVLLTGAVFEFIYYMQKYREAIQESEAMKKAGLQSQYDSLKNQVNPHFLFNSLNSLSALISEDRGKAGIFLDELSSVYRYLLQAGQRPLVTLADEAAFLHAYRYLLDTRFGNALRWEISLDESFMGHWLPPLTVQTLVENALRLNMALPDRPLTLHITTQPAGTLTVCNSLQRKKVAVLAPQGGLTILAERYTSLGLAAPFIEDDGEQFTVRLPLTPKERIPDIPTDLVSYPSSL